MAQRDLAERHLGGAAGCMPVMVGWATVTDSTGGAFNAGWASWGQALILFLIIFWTPPHTWALGMRYREDYEAAGVPMMPVVNRRWRSPDRSSGTPGRPSSPRCCSFRLRLGYAAIALLSGAWFIFRAHGLHNGVKKGIKVKPMNLFFLSNNYLSILFVGLSVDAVIGWRPSQRWSGSRHSSGSHPSTIPPEAPGRVAGLPSLAACPQGREEHSIENPVNGSVQRILDREWLFCSAQRSRTAVRRGWLVTLARSCCGGRVVWT